MKKVSKLKQQELLQAECEKLFRKDADFVRMIWNALVNKPMGLTRDEMKKLGLPFQSNYADSADSALTILKRRGLIRVAGFKSGKRNGQGSSIYQLTRPGVPVSVLGNKAIKKVA